jgi:hypothetical protein
VRRRNNHPRSGLKRFALTFLLLLSLLVPQAIGEEKEPVPPSKSALVVVVVGGGIEAEGGVKGQKAHLRKIWGLIRRQGALVLNIANPEGVDRATWMATLLTGFTIKSFKKEGDLLAFRDPTLHTLFRKITGTPPWETWIVSRGDEAFIGYRGLPLKGESRILAPVAVTSQTLNRIDGIVGEHIRAQRDKGKSKKAVLEGLKRNLTPRVLQLEKEFESRGVQEFLKDGVAERKGAPTDSREFVQRLGVQLLKDPARIPHLALFRLRGAESLPFENPTEKRERMAKTLRSHDETCYAFWNAFRSNPAVRNAGTFIILFEFGGAVFVGPKIKTGVFDKPYLLNQLFPTLVALLGFEFKKFTAPCPMKPPAFPMREIFKKDVLPPEAGPIPPPPKADLNTDVTEGPSPLRVRFTLLNTGGPITRGGVWSFGDGGTSSAKRPLHVYRRPGVYSVSLTVEGPGGTSKVMREDLIHVLPGKTPPPARESPPKAASKKERQDPGRLRIGLFLGPWFVLNGFEGETPSESYEISSGAFFFLKPDFQAEIAEGFGARLSAELNLGQGLWAGVVSLSGLYAFSLPSLAPDLLWDNTPFLRAGICFGRFDGHEVPGDFGLGFGGEFGGGVDLRIKGLPQALWVTAEIFFRYLAFGYDATPEMVSSDPAFGGIGFVFQVGVHYAFDY